MSQIHTPILELTADEAHAEFLKSRNYCNFPLPPYFDFSTLLFDLSNSLSRKPLSVHLGLKTVTNMADADKLNHIIYANKNSSLSWRPLQLIHPLAYLALVNVLTEANNWQRIKDRFAQLSSQSNVSCFSMPIVRQEDNNSVQGEQVLRWWREIEQKSIILSLEYNYIFNTDVSDCYSSIYTHSIAWAIDDKHIAKTPEYRNNLDNFGNKVDKCIQQMQNRQTNGIPQGSALMDFIAEILFNYLDYLLTIEIEQQNINKNNYKILRYRDDYRIFSKNKSDGEKILKTLSELLRDFGLQLNESKTLSSNDIITNSIKKDKLPSLEVIFNEKMGLQKKLLVLREHSKKYPNSGSIFRLLKHLRQETDLNTGKINYEAVIAILLDIGINNPRAISYVCAFISDLLPLMNNSDEISNLIFIKLSKMPNSGLSQIWLQRILKDNLQSYSFSEKLCQQVNANKFASDLWDISWLPQTDDKHQIEQNLIEIRRIMESTPIFCRTKFDELPENIPVAEIDIFNEYNY